MEYRLQLDEVQGSQTGTSGVKGSGAPCQAISPIMECGRQTTFINIQMRQMRLPRRSVCGAIAVRGACARKNKDATMAACVGMPPVHVARAAVAVLPIF